MKHLDVKNNAITELEICINVFLQALGLLFNTFFALEDSKIPSKREMTFSSALLLIVLLSFCYYLAIYKEID